MGFTIKDLESRLNPLRPDLEPGFISKVAQEVAKRVMRESYLFQTCSVVFPVTGNTGEALLTSSLPYWDTTNDVPSAIQGGQLGLDLSKAIYPSCWDGSTPDDISGIDLDPTQKTPADVHRVLRVRLARVPYLPSSTFDGWTLLTPSTSSQTLPSPVTAGAGHFTLVYGTGSLVDPSNSHVFSVKTGDMLQSNGHQWLILPLEKYDTLTQVNYQAVNQYSVRPQSNFNSAMGSLQWSQHYGQMAATRDLPGPYNTISVIPAVTRDLPGPYYTISVIPAVTSFVFDGDGHQVPDPIVLNVVISRFNGHSASIDVSCAEMTGDGWVGTINGIMMLSGQPQVVAAPDSFTIELSGSQQGWGEVESNFPTFVSAIDSDGVANNTTIHLRFSRGEEMPQFQSYMGQIVDLYPFQGYDTAIEFLYAAIPVGDIGGILLNLPNEAQDAIVAGTLMEILAIPGQHQNLNYSEVKREEFERLKGNLRAVGTLGMGGNPTFQAPPFGGRGNSYWPAGVVPWTLSGPGMR